MVHEGHGRRGQFGGDGLRSLFPGKEDGPTREDVWRVFHDVWEIEANIAGFGGEMSDAVF